MDVCHGRNKIKQMFVSMDLNASGGLTLTEIRFEKSVAYIKKNMGEKHE